MISIICVSNNKKTLDKCLKKSLKAQTYKDYELIVVDSIKQKFSGAAAALNAGAKRANSKSKYLIFCHNDVILERERELDSIMRQVEKLKKLGVVGVAGKDTEGIYRGSIFHGVDKIRVNKNILKSPSQVQTVDEVMLIVKKSVFDTYQFDEANTTWHLYGVEYCLWLEDKGFINYVVPSELYHKSAGNSMDKIYYKELKRYLKDHKTRKKIYTTMGNFSSNTLILNLGIFWNNLFSKIYRTYFNIRKRLC